MVSIANDLTIAGIMIQTTVIFWVARDVFLTYDRYYKKEIMRNDWRQTKFMNMKKEQVPILIALLIASALQIMAFVI